MAVLFSATTVMVGFTSYTFGLFVEPLSDEFGWSRTQISISLSFSAFGTLIGPFVGRIIDRRGPRAVMAVSLGLTGLSFFVRPLMTELWHWYAASFIQFLGMSAVMTPVGRIVGLWFPRTRGRVTGVAMMGNNFGGVLWPAVIGSTIALTSWQTGFIAQGLFAGLVALFAVVALREPPSGVVSARRTGTRSQSPDRELPGMALSEAIRSPVLYVFVFIFLVGSVPFATLIPQFITHATNEGLSQGVASGALSLLAIGGMCGKVGFGIIAEKITARRSMMVSFSGLSLSLILVLNPSVPGLVWFAAPMWGFCMGSFGTLITMTIQDYFGLKSFGSIMGLISYGTAVSFAVGPIAAGLAFDLTGSYDAAYIGTVGLLWTGVALLFSIRKAKRFTSE